MVVERITPLSASVRKDPRHVEPGSTESRARSYSPTSSVKSLQKIEDDEQMQSSPLSTPPSTTYLQRRSNTPSRSPSISIIDDDSPLTANSSEVDLTNSGYSSANSPAHSSQILPKSSEHMSLGTSSSSSLSAHAEPIPNPADKAISKSISTVPRKPRAGQPFVISTNDKPSVSKKRKALHQASVDSRGGLNPRSQYRPLLAASDISSSRVDPDDTIGLAYDLDRDPTQEVHEFRALFQESSSSCSTVSARFLYARLFGRPTNPTTINDEPTNCEGDLVTEWIESAAMGSVGPRDEVTPSFTVDSSEVLGNSQPHAGYGDLDLGATDLYPPSMDDIINHPQTMIDPSLLSGTPVFTELRSPSPAPAPFGDFHSWKSTRTPSPPLTQSALSIRAPPHASTSGLNSAETPRDTEGQPGGGKAKFYKKGTLQTPPYLSNSQSRRNPKATPRLHASRRLPSDGMHEIASPLAEFGASEILANGTISTPSFATSSEVDKLTDEDTTIIGSGSSGSRTPPSHVTKGRTATTRKPKNGANNGGPYRIVAVNEKGYCHQCRNSTTNPKMCCRNCPKQYCILCIVKRYHDMEFHQFKKDFDCPSCLNKCNCTSCCDKRREVYITTRHVKFDSKTMDKLLSGEIRSMPHLSAMFTHPPKGSKPRQVPTSSREVLPSAARKARASTRWKRTSSRQYTPDSDDDYLDEGGASKAQSASARVKPAEAALQTQRMLEESGSGRYWGAVYSLSGERIGESYVGNNLQNVTVQTRRSSASVAGYTSLQRKRIYAGRWQDAWGLRPETSDGSHSEGETRTNKRSGKKKDPVRLYYVGNQNIIKAWRKAQSRTTQLLPTTSLLPSDGTSIHVPSSDPLSPDGACDPRGVAGASPNVGVPVGDEEDEDAGGNYWTMEDRSPPKHTNLSFAATNIPGPGLGTINDILDVYPTSTLESRGQLQLVGQEVLAEAVASGLEAVGTTVVLSQPSLSLSTLSC